MTQEQLEEAMHTLYGVETTPRFQVDRTLIVVAAVNNAFRDNIPTYKGGEVVVINTSEGGYATGAYIDAYHDYPDYHSYLFIHDSMRGVAPDVVREFRENGADVVAWGIFPMSWDSSDQRQRVVNQYPDVAVPLWGIFGPTFYATREAMEKAEPFFPRIPRNRMDFQGTERAWAFCFEAAGIPVASLGIWNNTLMSDGPYPVFRKTFGGRA
jgi:hypothetical protein